MRSPEPTRALLMAPLLGLLDGWNVKLPVALLGALLMEALGHVGGLYGEILTAQPVIIFAIANLMLLDIITGTAAALKRGEKLSSKAFRRTSWKIIEYSALGFVGLLLTNGFAESEYASLTAPVANGMFVYIGVTEAFSIFENITGSREGAIRLVRRLQGIWTGRDEEGRPTITIEEVVTRESVPAPVDPPSAPTAADRTEDRPEPPPTP